MSKIIPLPVHVSEALSQAGGDADPWTTLMGAIANVFVFDQAILLQEEADGWHCATSVPEELSDVCWLSGPSFDEVAAGRILATPDNHQLEEWKEFSHPHVSPAQPALYLPLPIHTRRGLLMLLRTSGKHAFDEDDVARARQFALLALAALAARRADKMQWELTHLRSEVASLRVNAGDLARRAYTDELTGLANRAQIQERVDHMLRAGAPGFALAFIDLDNFKHINDYYNHAVGDALLVKVASRIADLLRETDMLARISGDEFLLLIQPIDEDADIRQVIDDLVNKLKQPFQVEGFEMFTSASVGVSIYPAHGTSYEELRRNADSAMYRAKSSAKGAAAFYDVTVGQAMSARMQLEQRLRLAIRDRQFCCAFQPKVDIRSQEVVGFETLVRWRDQGGEIQSPLAFIGLATELGVIDPITHFVLAEAITSIDGLDEAFGPGKSIAVNVAAKQAGDLTFMRTFLDTLKASGCADRFIVEVTEDAFISKNRFQTQVLPMLREVGARVSIDDFGTGYSSLSILADITADEIKIDRSFITGVHQRPRSQSVLKAIESVSLALGMSVVAEGVESFEELAYLLGATRIRFAQGYHFAKPFFLEDIVKASGATGHERVIPTGRLRPESRHAAAARAAATLRRN